MSDRALLNRSAGIEENLRVGSPKRTRLAEDAPGYLGLGASRRGVRFLGKHPKILDLLTMANKVADTSATVLIVGESGTGKELIAHLIREKSSRRDQTIVPVNCGAIPESLQESEFFGYVKGAFTGATQRKVGKLERAHRGTLFLDEISDMNPSLQAALLRTLQSGEYSPLGCSETRYCDVRVIAATNQNLLDLVGSGRFRRDLYYRINIIRLDIPPLREHKCDIPLLCNHMLRVMGAKQSDAGLSREMLDVLVSYDYPGNVRELENIIQRALILSGGERLTLDHLAPEVRAASQSGADLPGESDFHSAKARVVEAFERDYLTGALRRFGGIVSRAAHASGLSERNFHEKLKRYDICAKGFRDPVASELEAIGASSSHHSNGSLAD